METPRRSEAELDRESRRRWTLTITLGVYISCYHEDGRSSGRTWAPKCVSRCGKHLEEKKTGR